MDEYHKSLYRKQKEEKAKSVAPSKSEHVGKADKKRHEQEGKPAALKSKHNQDESPHDAPAAAVTQPHSLGANSAGYELNICSVFSFVRDTKKVLTNFFSCSS